MIHELQTFANLLFVLAMTAGLLYGVVSLARQVDWRRAPEQFWRHPAYVPLILTFILLPLELAWVAFGLMVEGFGVAHFTKGHVYNSTLNGMENIFGWFGILMLILWVGEKGYVDGLKPLLQKMRAAMKL